MSSSFPVPLRLEFLRRPAVEGTVASTKSDIYRKIKAGSFPPPIKLAQRHAVWLRHEIDGWQRAIAAGASEQQLCELVIAMKAARPQLSDAPGDL